MFKFKKKVPGKKSILFIEVLQNGEFLAEARREMGHRTQIAITSSSKGALPVPYYPLPHDIELIRVDHRGAHITIEPTWEGFITCDEQLINIKSGGRNTRTYIMRDGDYGSISWNDLRVLIRIGITREPIVKAVAHDPAYAGPLLPLWIGGSRDIQWLAFGTVFAACVFGVFIGWLMTIGDHHPSRLADLSSEYVLPFINSEHLRTLPEALQTNLERERPLVSAIHYYNSLTDMILGYDLKPSKYTMPTSRDMYEQLYRDNRRLLTAKTAQQSERDAAVFGKQGIAMLSIPVILGESFQGSLLRLSDKLTLLHSSLNENLGLRRTAIEQFGNDTKYDFGEFKNLKVKDKTKEALSKIKVWSILTDEQTMYKSAEDLEVAARGQQLRIADAREPLVPLTLDNAAPIAIKDVNEFASFVQYARGIHSNKIDHILASRFGGHLDDRIREPLIGEIDPSLVEKTIITNRFELQLCFELALRRNQLLSGTMEWRWLLDSRGTISDLELVETSINDRSMIRCIQRKISGWKFPRPRRGSVEIRFPFNFTQTKG